MDHFVKQIPAVILGLEQLLGGQARVTSMFTPELYRRAMAKARGTQEALYPIIPIKDARRHTNVIGTLMVMTGCLLLTKNTRGSSYTLAMNTFLTGAGIYSFRRMKIPYWLPTVNMILGLVVWYVENNTKTD